MLGVLVLLFFKDPQTSDQSERFNFKQVLTVIRLPQVWILCLILCCTYVMNMSYSYFNPYATSTLGVAMVGGTIVTHGGEGTDVVGPDGHDGGADHGPAPGGGGVGVEAGVGHVHHVGAARH